MDEGRKRVIGIMAAILSALHMQRADDLFGMPNGALHTNRPRRRLATLQKLFWIVLRRLWSRWKEPLILVTPKTVVAWNRAGFRLYWKWLSRAKRVGGRKRLSQEARALIFRMATENPTWGAPRIHGELLKLGFDLSEPTIARSPTARRGRAKLSADERHQRMV